MSEIGCRIWMNNNSNMQYYIFPLNERPINNDLYVLKSIGAYYLLFDGILPIDLQIVTMISK